MSCSGNYSSCSDGMRSDGVHCSSEDSARALQKVSLGHRDVAESWYLQSWEADSSSPGRQAEVSGEADCAGKKSIDKMEFWCYNIIRK